MANSKIIYAIVGILFLVILASIVYVKVPAVKETVLGSSLMSLQQVDLSSSSSYLSRKKWVYTFRAGGLGQNAYGYVSTVVADQMYSGIERPKENLRIDTSYDQSCNYRIKQSSTTPIYEFSLKSWTDLIGVGGCSLDKIKSNCPNSVAYWRPTGITCYCINRNQIVNSIGYLDNYEVKTKIGITVTVNGKVDITTLDTSKSIQGAVGPNVYAVWQGNLATGQSCSSPSQVLPIYTSNGWVLSDSNLYTTYNTAYTSFDTLTDSYLNTKPSPDSVRNLLNGLNAKAYAVRDARKTFGEINEPSSLSSAYVNKPVISFIQYPVLTLYVKADYLGIYTPVPIPSIISASSNCFATSQNGYINAVIKNSGEKGNINIYAECDSGFSAIRQEISFNAGEQKSVSLPLSGTGSKVKNTGNCIVYAEAIGTKASKNVAVCVTVPQICTPNMQRCQVNDIKRCDSEGLNELVIQTCPNGCELINNMPICKEQQIGCTTDEFCMAQNYKESDPCKLWECDKSLIGKNVCSPYESEEDKCKVDACSPINIGGLIVFPDLSSKCFGSKNWLSNIYYWLKIGIYALSLFLLWLPISELLKKLGLKGNGKKAGGIDILRIVMSLIIGWFVSVLIWNLLTAFIILAILFTIGAIALKMLKPF